MTHDIYMVGSPWSSSRLLLSRRHLVMGKAAHQTSRPGARPVVLDCSYEAPFPVNAAGEAYGQLSLAGALSRARPLANRGPFVIWEGA